MQIKYKTIYNKFFNTLWIKFISIGPASDSYCYGALHEPVYPSLLSKCTTYDNKIPKTTTNTTVIIWKYWIRLTAPCSSLWHSVKLFTFVKSWLLFGCSPSGDPLQTPTALPFLVTSLVCAHLRRCWLIFLPDVSYKIKIYT